jgi:hypothetical protein
MAFQALLSLGAAVVGVVLIVTALMKVAAPFAFFRHVARLELTLGISNRVIVPIAIGIEGALGAALLVRLAPNVVLPITAASFVALTGLTVWSITSGKTADCGCYGGFITPSISQSVALNGIYVLLVIGAWMTMPPQTAGESWRVATVVLAGILFGGTANYALQHEFRTGVALFTPSPLRAGVKWKTAWSGTTPRSPSGELIVTYLGPDCPYCQRWVRALNVIHESSKLPPVTGIMSSPRQTISDFVKETGVRFPVSTISEARMQRLATAVPTTVLIGNDVIQDVWTGAQLSEGFAERFKEVFFPLARERRDQSPRIPEKISSG